MKAASAAATEPGPDAEKRIGQRHFASAMEEVISAKTIMQQSLFTDAIAAPDPIPALQHREIRWDAPTIIALVTALVALLVSFLAIALVYLR